MTSRSGLQRVLDGEALAQELGVPGELDARARRRELGEPLGEAGRGTDRHGGLARDDARPPQVRGERVDGGVDVAQVGGELAPLLRGADAEEVHVAELRHLLDGCREAQPARVHLLRDAVRRARARRTAPGPPASAATFSGSTSRPSTSKPSSAMQAACVAPR